MPKQLENAPCDPQQSAGCNENRQRIQQLCDENHTSCQGGKDFETSFLVRALRPSSSSWQSLFYSEQLLTRQNKNQRRSASHKLRSGNQADCLDSMGPCFSASPVSSPLSRTTAEGLAHGSSIASLIQMLQKLLACGDFGNSTSKSNG